MKYRLVGCIVTLGGLLSVVTAQASELELVRQAMEAGRWIEARARLERLLRERPDWYAARRMRVEVYLHLGLLAEAEAEVTALRAQGESDPEWWRLMGDVQAAGGRWDGAYEAYQRGRELSPRDRTLLLRLGGAALWIQAFEPARQAFEAVLRERPQDPEAHYGLARLEALLGKPELALRHLEVCFAQGWIQPEAIRRDPVFVKVTRLPGFPR
ncbi:MAG: tetratricopeptide repeat protein [Bacteroidetes bacterium]|nr:tetratricopeptide repeat protein [Rhodothermia bacterium]MCX7906327.1 tetratricopeptide repeat protein [Bacteroidota bacterium]